MWNSHSDTDILDFALLWVPLGGPAPENIASAFSIDTREYARRLQAATQHQLARLQQGITFPEHSYAPSAIAAFDRDPPQEHVMQAIEP